jgi:hypothetical protein
MSWLALSRSDFFSIWNAGTDYTTAELTTSTNGVQASTLLMLIFRFAQNFCDMLDKIFDIHLYVPTSYQ